MTPKYPKEIAIAKSLAIFSAFTEGVSLFSSFAVLLNFSRFNKLKGVGQIISWSIRDESLHSQAGCWLFRKFIEENPEIWTDEFKRDIYQAARDTVTLEDDFIDKVFEDGEVEGLDPKDLKVFIRNRANQKLGEIGLKKNWKNVDEDALKRMEWFDFLSVGVEHTDFFSQRVTAYSKGTTNFDDMF
jgi:ribonucleoside-diphosphate reductase beta chain